MAELNLELGRVEEALTAFQRLRELDDTAGQEAYPEVLAFLEAQAAEQTGESAGVGAPSREQLQATLSESLAEYRRMHADDRRLASEDLLG